MHSLLYMVAGLLLALPARAEIAVADDTGSVIRLTAPARRIVSLAPHITETLFAAGAGDRLVGAVDYSDYPVVAQRVPRIGSYTSPDLETIAALKPDLALGWTSGNPPASLDRLRALGIPVFLSQPDRIEDVAKDLERYGTLAGTSPTAQAAAAAFRERLQQMRRQYSTRPPVRTFYQVWKQPLLTVGGRQIIGDVIRLCGGENVFAALQPLAPAVTVEAVLAANPEAIVASGMDASRPEWLDDWKRWTSLTAVKRDNLFFVPPDLIQRHTPRLIEGATRLCAHLETARARRASQ